MRGKGEMDLFLESFQKLRKKVLALCFGSVRNPVQTHIKEGQSYLFTDGFESTRNCPWCSPLLPHNPLGVRIRA